MRDFFRRIKLTQDLSGFIYFENFLIATVVTILGVRFFLKISGYPQLGGSGFHIAHMLWGGLLLIFCLLAMMLFMDRRIKGIVAIFGGIGFGLFIDELGKFITSDNNYFFQPTIAFIYLFCVLLFLLLYSIKNYMKISKEEYISNALDIFRNALVHGISDIEKDQVMDYLKEAKADFDLEILYKSTKHKESDREEAFVFLQKVRKDFLEFVNKLVSKKAFQIVVITLIELQAIFAFFAVIFIIVYFSGIIPKHIHEQLVLDLSFATTAAIVSSFAAGVFAILGALHFPRSKEKAFSYIKYSLLISIFIVQFFIFWVSQFGALVGLVFDVLALQAVNVILSKKRS